MADIENPELLSEVETARAELNAAVTEGFDGAPVNPGVLVYREEAFRRTLLNAILKEGPGYWKDRQRDFALGNARYIGQVSAILAAAAGHPEITAADYRSAANAVVRAAQDRCPAGPLMPGIQCQAWGRGI